MHTDSDDAIRVFEELLNECVRCLELVSNHDRVWDHWWERFPKVLFSEVHELAVKSGVNTPVRVDVSPFRKETVLSLWCPWENACVFAGPRRLFSPQHSAVLETMLKWVSWMRINRIEAPNERPPRCFRNHFAWPPTDADWRRRLARREPECHQCLEENDAGRLAAIFSQSSAAFLVAIDWWTDLVRTLFRPHQTDGPNNNWLVLPDEVSAEQRRSLRDGLTTIMNAKAAVKPESNIHLIDSMNGDLLEAVRVGVLVVKSSSKEMKNQSSFETLCHARESMENLLLRDWLNELAANSPTPTPRNDAVTIGPFGIAIDDRNHKMMRNGKVADFPRTVDSDDWAFATELIRAGGKSVDFRTSLPEQKPGSLRTIKARVSQALRILTIDVQHVPKMTSTWKAVDKGEMRDK